MYDEWLQLYLPEFLSLFVENLRLDVCAYNVIPNGVVHIVKIGELYRSDKEQCAVRVI